MLWALLFACADSEPKEAVESVPDEVVVDQYDPCASPGTDGGPR